MKPPTSARIPAPPDATAVAALIRVVIADDHPAFRMGLAALIKEQPDMEVVAVAADGAQAVEACRRHTPEVVLMDLMMPGMSGIEATRAIVAERLRTQVVVLTTYDMDEDLYRAMQVGARAYLLKDMTIPEIAETIRQVAAGRKVLPPALAQRLKTRLIRQDLSEREQQVLRLLADGRSNKEISSALLISEDTVKTHLKNLFAKMGVADRTEAVVAAVRSGIIHFS